MTNTLLPPQLVEFVTVLDHAAEIQRDPSLKSAHTKKIYTSILNTFEAWRNGRELTKTLIEEYASTFQARHAAPATIKQVLAVIKWWTRRIVDLAYEQLPRARADEIAMQAARIITIRERDIAKGSRLPAGRHITNAELESLLKACTDDPTPAGVRDAAFIAVAIPTMARNEEMRNLTIDDLQYTETGADVTIRHGKGDKSRIVYLSGNSIAAMNAWLDIRGAGPGPLFCVIQKNGKLINRSPTYEATRLILRKRFLQSDLKESISWHDFRRTTAGNLFANNVPDATIQGLLGHVSIVTSRRYNRRPAEIAREAIELIEVPYITPLRGQK